MRSAAGPAVAAALEQLAAKVQRESRQTLVVPGAVFAPCNNHNGGMAGKWGDTLTSTARKWAHTRHHGIKLTVECTEGPSFRAHYCNELIVVALLGTISM